MPKFTVEYEMTPFQRVRNFILGWQSKNDRKFGGNKLSVYSKVSKTISVKSTEIMCLKNLTFPSTIAVNILMCH